MGTVQESRDSGLAEDVFDGFVIDNSIAKTENLELELWTHVKVVGICAGEVGDDSKVGVRSVENRGLYDVDWMRKR